MGMASGPDPGLALWPRPRRDIEQACRDKKSNAAKAGKGVCRYPEDFLPYDDPIESSAALNNTKDRKDDANSGHMAEDDGDEDDEEIGEDRWPASPPRPARTKPEGDDEDSEAESTLDDQVPPTSSAIQGDPAGEAAFESQTTGLKASSNNRCSTPSTKLAVSRPSPPKARVIAYPLEPVESSPSPVYENGGHDSPSSDKGTLRDSSDSDDNMRDEEEEEEPEEIQVMQTPSGVFVPIVYQAPGEDPCRIPESSKYPTVASTQNNPNNGEEGDIEKPLASSFSPPSRVDNYAVQITPASSPTTNKRKADDLENSPAKAGSLKSPMLLHRTKVVKVADMGVDVQKLKQSFEHLKRSRKDGMRKGLGILASDLNGKSKLEELKEQQRKQREALFQSSSTETAQPKALGKLARPK
ncbi:hypothetical protein ABW19_dt0208285 [Dactylella cylindrospora]|nr:hypothetical protein ABW19_dt0208285 [Dactylella cylindrospora]